MKYLSPIFLTFAILTLNLQSVIASEISSESKVSVSTNTGGNKSNGNSITTGSSEASVRIETVINGEVVEDINEKFFSTDGESILIETESLYKTDSEGNVTKTSFSTTTKGESGVEANQESKPDAVSQNFSIKVFFRKIFNYVFSLFKF